jgi:predicted deacetylase
MRPDTQTSPGRNVCVVMHDVAPATWDRCQHLLDALDEVRPVRTTLLVVPEYHGGRAVKDDPDFLDAMQSRLARGDELALHGYSHLDDQAVRGVEDYVMRRLYTASEGEFSALPATIAKARLRRGVECFEAQGWPLAGFVAPAWLMSAGTWEALRDFGRDFTFSYVTTLRHMVLWPEGRRVRAPSLTYSTRSTWRRQASHLWNRHMLRMQQSRETIRLGLHPADADHADVVRRWQDILASCLADREPVTKAELAQALRRQYVD